MQNAERRKMSKDQTVSFNNNFSFSEEFRRFCLKFLLRLSGSFRIIYYNNMLTVVQISWATFGDWAVKNGRAVCSVREKTVNFYFDEK